MDVKKYAVREVTVPFDVKENDGLNFSGYAAVFDSPTVIHDYDGDFRETIKHGAFTHTLSRRMPVLMFNHGSHPLIGDMPLGVISNAREDIKGLYIEARLSDNWLISPVRDAVASGAISGMSFRFIVSDTGDSWNRDFTERTITSFDDVPELGPVVFPAYEPTTASVRSVLDSLGVTRDTVDPVKQAQAVDATLDEAVNLLRGVSLDGLPLNVQQAIGLVFAAQSSVDELLEIMDIYDPDDPESKGNAGRSRAGRTDGGSGREFNKAVAMRDRLLKMRGIL